MTHRQHKTGFTIIELLIVITIMSIMLVLLVPRLRTVSKDRNIREAARSVAALFAKASQQAVVDGSAGVLLERNPNFIYRLPPGEDRGLTGDPFAVPYAVNTLFLLRAVPPYTGDYVGDTAEVTATGTTVTISRPLDHDEGAGKFFIVPRDTIYLNNQGFGYRITDVVEDLTLPAMYPNGRLVLTIAFDSFPAPNDTVAPVPYKIQRQPRKVESSRVNLPAGYMVNLRFSGPMSGAGLYPETVLSSFTTTDDTDVRFFLNASGGVKWFQTGAGLDTVSSGTPAAAAEDFTASNSLFLMVCEDDLQLETNEDQLMIATNLWVTLSATGNVNVGSIAPQGPATIDGGTQEETPTSFATRLTASRDIARTRQIATQ